MSWRLPKRLEFPWGFNITVSVVERAEIGDAHGEWDCDEAIGHIKIARDLTPAEKRATLIHEIGHAYLDWQSWATQNVPLKEPRSLDPDLEEVDDDAEA